MLTSKKNRHSESVYLGQTTWDNERDNLAGYAFNCANCDRYSVSKINDGFLTRFWPFLTDICHLLFLTVLYPTLGVPSACTWVAMGVQQQLDELTLDGRTDWAVLQIDFTNAFNAVKRGVLMEAVGRRCPELVPWVQTCYCDHSPLYCGENRIVSASGIQQGTRVA